MNYSLRSILHLSLLAVSAYGFNDAAPVAPQTERLEPRVGKPGTIIKITGKALDKSHVDEVFLTDHRFDMKVKVLEQNEHNLTIRVPPFAKAGRLQLLLLTAGSHPVYLEQPLFVQIENDEELPAPTEISKASKPTVEVASTGASVAVPMAAAPASPAMSASVEKSVVPLKTAPTAVAPVESKPEKPTVPEDTLKKTMEIAAARAVPPLPPPASPVVSVPAPALPNLPATRPNSGSVQAKLVRRERVNYPSAAQAQKIEGTVELIAIVNADGRVKDVKVLKGNPFLASAAINSVRLWVYEPASLNGQPVESEVSVLLHFKRPE